MAQPQPRHLLSQLLRKGVVHIIVNENLVRADAGLAGVSQAGAEEGEGGPVQVGILEHNKGGVAAELKADSLNGAGGLGHQQLAHRRAPREADLSNLAAPRELRPDGLGVPAHDLHPTLGKTSLVGKVGERDGTQRGLLGGLDDDGAARREGRADLPGDHREGKVPGGDGADYPDGLLQHHHPLPAFRALHHISVDPAGLLREPRHGVRPACDLDGRLADRLAVLQRQQGREVPGVLPNEPLPPH
mmetsp:Transcript_762/g.2982  ORF Transcript_762/g.2982 Transcript_762/m.2982 type:complete len:245 (-) Transcript_762:386-1120(-)